MSAKVPSATWCALIALLMSGCSETEKTLAAIKKMDDQCGKPLRVVFHAGSWSKDLTVHCDELKPGWNK